jgi:hypothetical protein
VELLRKIDLDLAIFNGQAIRLNEEALDVCQYQALD